MIKWRKDYLIAVIVICATLIGALLVERQDFQGITIHIGNSVVEVCTKKHPG